VFPRKQSGETRVAAQSASLRDDVRACMGGVARRLIDHVPASVCPDRQFLHECARPDGRRDYDNLARLLRVAVSTGQTHAVSDAIRSFELALAPAVAEEAALDLHLAEEAAEAALDQAQLLALQDPKCPARAAGMVELGRQAMRQIGRLVDYYSRRMHLTRSAV
jgi:hypothetical protein